MTQITGQDIVKFGTLSSMYDNDCIGCRDDKDNFYKMKTNEILKFNKPFNEMVFNIIQKKVYKYLEVVE